MPRSKPTGFIAAMADQDEWADLGLCPDEDPLLFDTRMKNQHTDITVDTETAMDICADCPVMIRCLEHAIRHDIREGVWGGMVVEERDLWALKHRPDLIPDDRLAVMPPALGPEGPWPAQAAA